MNDEANTALLRIEELASRLEERSRQCPGLYPVKSREDFIRIAADRLETESLIEPDKIAALPVEQIDSLCRWLEGIHRHPETSHQINSLSLIRRGAKTPFTTTEREEKQGEKARNLGVK